MSDIKSPTTTRIHGGRPASPGTEHGRNGLDGLPRGYTTTPLADRQAAPSRDLRDTALVPEFTAPPRETARWLADPAITATLAAVSRDLAPEGVAGNGRNQYVASVVETHLAARRQLARHLNSLLRA